MKLKDLLFITENNEEEIASIVFGDDNSIDPEDVRDTKTTEIKSVKVAVPEIPNPSKEIISIGNLTADTDQIESLKESRIKDDNKKEELFQSILSLAQDNSGARIFEEQKSSKKGFFRIKPVENLKKDLISRKITKQKFVEILRQAKEKMFEGLIVKEFEKGHPEGGSGTFSTYSITDLSSNVENTIKIVIASGGNKGHDFEKEVKMSIQNQSGLIWDNLMCFLIEKGKIESINDIEDYSVVTTAHQIKRPFSNKIQNIGSLVSDLTFNLKDGNFIYVSLKGERGTTFSNTGYSGVFKIEKIIENGEPAIKINTFKSSSNAGLFLDSLGVDLNKIARGFEAYGNSLLQNGIKYPYKSIVEPIDKSKGADSLDYLASQLGYGYVYFRRRKSGGYRILDLNSEQTTRDVFGEFISGNIRYPFYENENSKSKQCTIRINTSTADYYVEIRGTQGLTGPFDFLSGLQCNVSVINIKTEDFKCDTPDWRERLIGVIPVQESKTDTLNLKNWLY